jgi:hypothetical protein
VTYPEQTMRRIVDFAGLSWHPDCTRFYSNDRDVMTASAEQVRQPIYTTSVNRHRHYLDQLDPFKRVLIEAGIEPSRVPTRLH